MSTLANKVALVTGAGTGLGKHLTQQLVQAGAKVVAVGRSLNKLSLLQQQLGDAVLPLAADISDPNQVRRLFSQIDEQCSQLHILINNAGIYAPFLIDTASDEDLQHIIETNVLGAAYCMREAVKRMKIAEEGDIINVSSESARNPFPYLTFYAASKSALECLSAGQRMELAPFGIRVMILRSGSMVVEDHSGTIANWTDAEVQQVMAEWQRTGHQAFSGSGMKPATVAAAVINALSLPREATVDVIEVRSAR